MRTPRCIDNGDAQIGAQALGLPNEFQTFVTWLFKIGRKEIKILLIELTHCALDARSFYSMSWAADRGQAVPKPQPHQRMAGNKQDALLQ